MPRTLEEKEKCQEKLNQMQKYLPFLDFMIDKIKRTNEASLACQLNKFQVLKSMIAEKNEKYTWDSLIKAEQVIEKLILKLDYKGEIETTKASSGVKNIKNTKVNMSASIYRAPSTNSAEPKIQIDGSEVKNCSSGSVSKIMNKMSIGNNRNSNNQNQIDKDSPQSLEEKSESGVSGKNPGTNLDMGVDGLNSNSSDTSGSNFKKGLSSTFASSEKASSQEDLLSSSREKLLKSLQDTLFPNRVAKTSHFPNNKINTNRHSFSGETSIKNVDRNTVSESKYGSSESIESKNRNLEKPNSVSFKSNKVIEPLKKQRSNSDASESVNLKQKLKEKLSTDICEVYRVPGKSVGGSLRWLKDSRDHKKSSFVEEDELFRPDILTKVNVPSQGSSSNLQSTVTKDKYRQDSKISELKSVKNNNNVSQNFSGSGKNKQDDKHCKTSEFKSIKSSSLADKKSSNKQDKKDTNKLSEKEERTEFVKENIQQLRQLNKHKPPELKKSSESSFSEVVILSDLEDISDESVQEIDEYLNNTNRSPNGKNRSRERYPLASLKISEMCADSVPKNIKPGVSLSADLKAVDGSEDKFHDTDFSSTTDEEDNYIIKLIEETTPKITKKKKGLLELPMPETSDLFDDISSIESFESANSPPESRDPRLKKLTEKEKKQTTYEPGPKLKQSPNQFQNFELKSQEGFPRGSLLTDSRSGGHQRNEPKLEGSSIVSKLSVDAKKYDKKSKESKNSYSKAPSSLDRQHILSTHHAPVPKSYAEYKRMKRKEQEKLGHCEKMSEEVIQKFCGDNISENPQSLNDKNIRPNLIKTSESRTIKQGNSNSENHKSELSRSARKRRRRKLKKFLETIKYSEHSEENKKHLEIDHQKIIDEKRRVTESEESISPLERLYQTENKPKTGRGYGIQNFKIPKKIPKPISKSKENLGSTEKANNAKSDPRTEHINAQNEPESSLNKGNAMAPVLCEQEEEKTKTTPTISEQKKISGENRIVKESTNKSSCSENKRDSNKTIITEVNQKDKKVNSESDPRPIMDKQRQSKKKSKTESQTDNQSRAGVTCKSEAKADEQPQSKNKCETELGMDEQLQSKSTSKTDSEKDNQLQLGDTFKTESETDNQPHSGDTCKPDDQIQSGDTSKTEPTADEEPQLKNTSKTESEKNDQPQSKKSCETESKTDDQLQSVDTSKPEQCNVITGACELSEKKEGQEIEKVESELNSEKKSETEVIEKDSTVQHSLTNAIPVEKSNSTGEKGTVIPKEEITQEFVEALIRKSFESGQGKLLLAQAKLFEELGRKLNSKKLKTIQKIINSESDSSSSSSESCSSSVSSIDKKRKKSKKSKRPKRKGRKKKRLVISSTSTSSSSSSSESEESEEDRNLKKKKPNSPETQDKVHDKISLEEVEVKKNDVANRPRSRTKKKRLDYPGCFSRKKNKRKQNQKKLIEKILNETPINPEEASSRELEPKPKPKPKTKPKTELDKLHEDIKNMFISSGIVTSTGQRMCRILRNSGGRMDNLDIVKESARMVEEEKLLKVQAPYRNFRPRNPSRQDNRSRSQSLDKSLDRLCSTNQTGYEYNQDPKLKSASYVLLHKVDLNNFGYGVKVSEDCISFSRIQGRNTAIRGFKSCKNSTSDLPSVNPAQNLSKGIFLARNKRKYQRLSGKVCKTSYKGKKLMDVVKNLPLKMARMKHLEFCEKKSDDMRKKKIVPEKLERKMARLGETKQFTDDDLMNHAFQMKKTVYRCKVCSQNFRNITEHYKTAHPEHEVLISRLCQREATRAMSDAIKNNYEGEQNTPKESSKKNTKSVVKGSYQCRMCSFSRASDVNVFFTHVTTHTGEVRFQCPNEDCNVQTANREEIKFHILTRHPKSRYELYNKIIELYPSPIEGHQLFGYLCSKCNFVQLSRNNIEAHISKQHPSDDVKIFKINMSSDTPNQSKIKRMVMKNGGKNCEQLSQHKPAVKRNVEEVELEVIMPDKTDSPPGEDVGEVQQQKQECKEDESRGDVATLVTDEKFNLEAIENTQVTKVEEKIKNESITVKEQIVLKRECDVQENAAEYPQMGSSNGKIVETLEVGPLKSLLLENSEVYYKCQVQNCGIFMKGFEKFERHLGYKHCKKKWEGFCKLCLLNVSNDLPSALNHLKFHILKKKHSGSAVDLTSNKAELLKTSEVSVFLKQDVSAREEVKKVESTAGLYPTKPLLKVRNLLGDRLSTPKEKEVITITEEAVQSSLADKMFTIENVRSLNPEIVPDASDNNREQICIVQDPYSCGSQVGAGKVILVRSCPTRKIAIRPEKNTATPLDVGPFNLVQAPMVTHPVMLGQTLPGAPIHLLPPLNPPSQNSNFGVKPVRLPCAAPFNVNSNVMSVVRPAASSTIPSSISTTSDVSDTVQKSTPTDRPEEHCLIKSKNPIEITVSVSPSDIKSPLTLPRGKTVSEVSNPGEVEDVEIANPSRAFTSIGGKIMKDSSIYKQMLKKSKICHLFKCMAVECSFSCNSEKVFTRHIGLHEAHCRLKKKQNLKEGIPALKKPNKAFPWQQCAYCCEVLNCADNALSRHIITEHGHCTFQCAYCFYRAISQNYVEIHQNLVHSQLKANPRTIYKCKLLGNSRPAGLEKRGRKHSVRPYICDQCGMNFYIIQEFLTHLTTEHQAVTAYTCHICKNLCFKAKRLINHYKLHSYCTYQCAYCLHGTETEMEMVYHLCNFHFSNPAMMYIRALPEGVESQGVTQLESLKTVFYENDTPTGESIIETVGSEEEATYDPLKESLDLSEIAAELGINLEDQSKREITLLKDLASFGDQSAENVTVKTLLPNAQFSSEIHNPNEGCSVLISSGVSAASAQNDEKEISIPLGQLPLEALSIKHVQQPTSSKYAEFPNTNSSPNEVGINFQAKEQCEPLVNKLEEEKKTSEPPCTPCVHNLPQVLVSRTLGPKNVYSSKRLTAAKKPLENLTQGESKCIRENASDSNRILTDQDGKAVQCLTNKSDGNSTELSTVSVNVKQDLPEKDSVSVKSTQPLITNVVSLSKSGFENEDKKSISNLLENTVSKDKNLQPNEPPAPNESAVNIVENIQMDDSSMSLDATPELVIDETPIEKMEAKKSYTPPKSPDVVILEDEKPNKNIETVTLDSDDEKEPKNSRDKSLKNPPEMSGNGEIRKEMEVLRNQMTKETDSLLFDVPQENPTELDLKIRIGQDHNKEDQSKTILSPIEEAICSLNEKLRSESAKPEEKEPKFDSKAGANSSDNVESDKPRTRFGSREKKRECVEEKSSEEDVKKEESCKNKKIRKELVGKELYICGNEQCTFAAENNASLKDHLYVCDFSRLSSVLMCPHCSKNFKQFNPYLEHLKYHGEKKFHCGLCPFASAVESAVLKHLKQKHKCHITKTVPKDPPEEEHLLFYPKNYKIDKVDFEENGYSPGDEDKLPLQSVYLVNVKCAKCPYFTKVRSNMVRHLKIHTKSAEIEGVVVPSTAPTNPVPCLETKEKMFDKMTNLAASSQLAQAEREKCTALSPQVEAKFPQFIPEQLRFKCCLPDCNYITIDDRMLKHHIKALHNEITHYNCPHCRSTVHVDIRNTSLEKIGHHLKFHDSKLYKCGHCIFIHYQKNLIEKHSNEKHPDRRCFIQTVRDSGAASEEEQQQSGSEGDASVWKCALCEEFQSLSKSKLKDHLFNTHKVRSNYQCQHCSMTGNNLKMFANHFASKHPGEKVSFFPLFNELKVPSSKLGSLSGSSSGADSSNEHFDTTPLWQRGVPRIRHIRGILIEEEEVKTKRPKRWSFEDAEGSVSEPVPPRDKVFHCNLCSDRKVFFTKNEDIFRAHLYQELNYYQLACISCGKMCVDRKDFEKHHARMHPDKPPEANQTKEDKEITFWVEQVIEKQREVIRESKRKLMETESIESSSSPKKIKES